ncbi:MAG: class I tRNA ligase family protein, partial [Cyclobacteriaceae bacterium]
VLHDLGYLNFDEPFKKLINQGKITGDSRFVYRCTIAATLENAPDDLKMGDVKKATIPVLASYNVVERFASGKETAADLETIEQVKKSFLKKSGWNSVQISMFAPQPLHIDIKLVNGLELDIIALRKWKPEFEDAEFILEDGKYICGSAIEKMSKSYFNVVNPDQIIDNYGADTLRMYEMFLGPLEASKPWSTQGIDGVYKFLRRVWNLVHDQAGNFKVSDVAPSREELKVLHKTIKKVEQDIENFSFNTSVSEFMICVNELSSLKCNKRAIVEPLIIAISPFAPHIAEELWEKLGHAESILTASFPKYDEQYVVESTFTYPISINGKVRAEMEFAVDMPKEDIERIVLASDIVQKWTEGKPPKKMIVVPGRIVNVVL